MAMRIWLAIAATAFIVSTLQVQASRQSSDEPRFEVASVKVNKANDGMIFQRSQKGRYTAVGFTLAALIRDAYRVQEFQIIGGPEWINSDRFNVEATYSESPPPASPSASSGTNLMLRALLAERFNLAVHNEKRERAVYAMVLARADRTFGPQLQKSVTDCTTALGGRDKCGSSVGPGFVRLHGRTMAQFAESLSLLTNTGSSLNRLIIDRTGLDGGYDAVLRFTPENIPGVAIPGLPPIDPNGPSIFTALQEQLGLKLDSQRAPVDVLVVDRAERPTEN
jgi:uncharacterized protein (TIGR03435 family)